MSTLSTTPIICQPSSAATTDRSAQFEFSSRDVLVKGLIVLASAAVLIVTSIVRPWKAAGDILLYSTPGFAFATAGIVYGSFSIIWSFWRLWLALRYRPFPMAAAKDLPRISIIVPAYNEGPLVAKTLQHLVRSDYPADRMEIIVVDDGSEDDTWSHIEAAAAKIGPRVTAIHCAANRGKRHALYEGFRRATGSIFVTVDSDSLVAPDALWSLVSPMIADTRIGAVAGKVRVLNRRDGLIPRMLNVRYIMTFDYKRAAQSVMAGGALLCCAGALAAYRRSAVMPILDKWLNQTFRGAKARAGEDHAMTNFILRQGFKSVYQRSAIAETQSPATYTKLCKMFLRWGRSNIRESIHTGQYIFGKFRPENVAGMRFNYIMAAVGLGLPYPFLICALILSIFLPTIFGLKMLASCVTCAIFPALFCIWRERSTEAVFAVPYAFYSTFLLWWIWPYALLTCNKSVWMTRTVTQPKSSRSPAVDQMPVPQAA